MYMYVHVLMRDEKESKQGQINNKEKQHSTPTCIYLFYLCHEDGVHGIAPTAGSASWDLNLHPDLRHQFIQATLRVQANQETMSLRFADVNCS